MGVEIEHKYLVINDEYKAMAISKKEIAQGYLSREKGRTIRIRIADGIGYITIKTATIYDTRKEYEYQVPYSDAKELLEICTPPIISKNRYIVPFEGFTWEVDEFLGELEGLTIAEIELPDSDSEYQLPNFIGENVTNNPNYYNSNIHTFANKFK